MFNIDDQVRFKQGYDGRVFRVSAVNGHFWDVKLQDHIGVIRLEFDGFGGKCEMRRAVSLFELADG